MKKLTEERREERESETRLQSFLGPPKKPKSKSPPSIRDRDWATLMEEAAAFARTGKWEGAQPRHFVALYDILHTRVYGVACVELGPRERFGASMKAKVMLEKQFNDDLSAMAEFLRWTWQREEWREKQGHRTGGRIGPWLQFNGAILTDYRLDMARRQKTG